MAKGILHLSIDTEVLALIKTRDDINSLSEFVENIFKIELNLNTDDKENEIGELKILNAKLSAELEKQKIEINQLKKLTKERPKERKGPMLKWNSTLKKMMPVNE